MGKIDIKHLVENDSTFRLNRKSMIGTVEDIIESIDGKNVLPFILFLDSEDHPSKRYVNFKMKDLELAPIDCIPMDISVLYNGKDFKYMLEREIEIKRSVYNMAYIPYIIQIPSDSARFKLFEKFNIEDTICNLMEKTAYEFLDPEWNGIKDAKIQDDLASTEIDALAYDESKSKMYRHLDRIYKSAASDECTLSSLIARSIIPATPKGILLLILHLLEVRKYNIKRYKKNFFGLKIAVVGCNSKTTGKYLKEILPNLKATVSLYHSASIISKDEFKDYDIVISCVGTPGLITKDHLGDSAFGRLLIDVGVSVIDGKVKGDFAEDTRESVLNHYTPYVNGVGLLTRAALMSNMVQAYSEIFKYNKIN